MLASIPSQQVESELTRFGNHSRDSVSSHPALEREPPVILDVCLNDDLSRHTDMLPGAAMHNPDAIDRWAETLPYSKPVVIYCFFGFQVSGDAVANLRRRGYDARALKGGIGAWHAIGGRTVPLDQTTYER